MRGTVTGTAPGDSVKVWFTGGGATSDSFTYHVQSDRSDTDRHVLIIAAEDYTGGRSSRRRHGAHSSWYHGPDGQRHGSTSMTSTPRPHGTGQPGRTEPLRRCHLVHGQRQRDARAGLGPGNASRLAMQELLEVRDYVNEGGRVLYTGQRAGQQYTTALGTQLYDPFENDRCRNADQAIRLPRCLALSGSGTPRATRSSTRSGRQSRARTAASTRTAVTCSTSQASPILQRDGWSLNGGNSARNQQVDASFIATGDFLKVTDPADKFPQFELPVAEYLSGIAGPFDPHTGSSFMWSERSDEAYKRLTRTITVPAGGATISFWTSYNLELDFDYLIVEAHTVGQDDWTTLPDQNAIRRTTCRRTSRARAAGATRPTPPTCCTRSSSITRRSTRTGPAPTPGPPASGTRRTAARAAGSSGSSTYPLRRQPGRDLDHCSERLGPAAVPGRVRRRHRRLDRRGQHLVRGRRRADGRLDRAGRSAGSGGNRGAEPQRLGPARRPRSRRARSSSRRTPSTWASASRASPGPRPGTTS